MIQVRFKISEEEACAKWEVVNDFIEQRAKLLQLDDTDLTRESIKEAAKSIIFNNFDLYAEPAHFYLQAKKVKGLVPVNGKLQEQWIKVLGFSTSPYGRLALAMQKGAIDFAYPAQIVREGDAFSKVIADGVPSINHTPLEGNKGRILSAYITLVVKGRNVTFSLSWADIERLAAYKKKQVQGRLEDTFYKDIDKGEIDEGFLKAKVLKHALKTLTNSVSVEQSEKFIIDEDVIEEKIIKPLNQEDGDFGF